MGVGVEEAVRQQLLQVALHGAAREQRAIDARRVAVEHNLAVVKKAAYDTSIVRDGDEVEIVNFVGGG